MNTVTRPSINLARRRVTSFIRRTTLPTTTGVDKGAEGPAPQWPGKKRFFFVKIEASLQLNPVVHVTITQREGDISIRCPTCILAYLIEIRKFCSKKPGS